MLRYIMRKTTQSPFSKQPLKLGDSFYNYHPKFIQDLLNKNGYFQLKTINTNCLRLPFLKQVIPHKFLYFLDRLIAPLFGLFNLSPSVFILCQLQKK